MNTTEISKLAHALNELRPDWPIASLRTWITRNLPNRAYRDAAVACVWVALDANVDGSYTSKTLARVLEAGPWWRAAAAGESGQVASRNPRPGEACVECGGFVGTCPCGRPAPTGPQRPVQVSGTPYAEQIRKTVFHP